MRRCGFTMVCDVYADGGGTMADLLVPFLLALTPIIWLVIALIGLKQQA